jgi:acetyl esterase/lipase
MGAKLHLGLLGICAALLFACAAPEGNAGPRPSPKTTRGGDAGPRPKERISYGSEPLQFGDLRVPSRAGPFPVAVVIHGGCWVNQYGLDLMDSMSESLRAAGVATWNIEYRRIGDTGGGYPNTMLDVGMAVDAVRELAPKYKLDLEKVVTVGHSAGGHLGVWVAARSKLSPQSALHGQDPLPIRAAVSLAGILDLKESISLGVCNGLAAKLVGGSPMEVPDRYAEVSPASLLPIGVRQVLIHGAADFIVSSSMSNHFLTAAKAAGEPDIKLVSIADADHFAMIEPSSSKWADVMAAILAAFQ